MGPRRASATPLGLCRNLGLAGALTLLAAVNLSACSTDAQPLNPGPDSEPETEQVPNQPVAPLDCSAPAEIFTWAPEGNELISGSMILGSASHNADFFVVGSNEVWKLSFWSDERTVVRVPNLRKLSPPVGMALSPRDIGYDAAIRERGANGQSHRIEAWWYDRSAETLEPATTRAARIDLLPGDGVHDATILSRGLAAVVSRENELRVVTSSGEAWMGAIDDDIAGAAAFPGSGFLAYRTQGPNPALQMVPLDFQGASNPGAPWTGPNCFAEGYPRVGRPDFDVVSRAGAVFIVASCPDQTLVERRTRDGRLEQTISFEGRPATAARAVFDGAGHLVVARWVRGRTTPTIHLLNPDNLSEVRAPVTLPREANYPSQASELVLAASSVGPGRVFVGYSYVIGHGLGDVEVARLQLCPGL